MALDLSAGTRPDVLTMLGSRSRYNRLMYLGMCAGVALLLVFGIWASGQGSMREPLKSQGTHLIKRIGVQPPDAPKATSSDTDAPAIATQAPAAAGTTSNGTATSEQQSQQGPAAARAFPADAGPSATKETAATSVNPAGSTGLNDIVATQAANTDRAASGGGSSTLQRGAEIAAAAGLTAVNSTEPTAKPDAEGG